MPSHQQRILDQLLQIEEFVRSFIQKPSESTLSAEAAGLESMRQRALDFAENLKLATEDEAKLLLSRDQAGREAFLAVCNDHRHSLKVGAKLHSEHEEEDTLALPYTELADWVSQRL